MAGFLARPFCVSRAHRRQGVTQAAGRAARARRCWLPGTATERAPSPSRLFHLPSRAATPRRSLDLPRRSIGYLAGKRFDRPARPKGWIRAWFFAPYKETWTCAFTAWAFALYLAEMDRKLVNYRRSAQLRRDTLVEEVTALRLEAGLPALSDASETEEEGRKIVDQAKQGGAVEVVRETCAEPEQEASPADGRVNDFERLAQLQAKRRATLALKWEEEKKALRVAGES